MADFDAVELDRIIEMAWEDRTPFEAIAYQFGVSEHCLLYTSPSPRD